MENVLFSSYTRQDPSPLITLSDTEVIASVVGALIQDASVLGSQLVFTEISNGDIRAMHSLSREDKGHGFDKGAINLTRATRNAGRATRGKYFVRVAWFRPLRLQGRGRGFDKPLTWVQPYRPKVDSMTKTQA